MALARTWKWLAASEQDDGSRDDVEACRRLYERVRELWGDRVDALIAGEDEWHFSWVTNCSWDRLQHAAWTLGIGAWTKCYIPRSDIDDETWAWLMDGQGDP